MLFLLGYIVQSQSMQRLQTGLVLLSKVPKARLEQESQENLQETCCFKQSERICTFSWQALE
jgi:hypothetical protein